MTPLARALAACVAATSEISRWRPGSAWIVGPMLHGGAALVGLSRMYEDRHWASDVVMGAAVGVFAGLKTVAFTRTREGNRIDRLLLGKADGATDGARASGGPRFHLRVVPSPGGFTAAVSSRW